MNIQNILIGLGVVVMVFMAIEFLKRMGRKPQKPVASATPTPRRSTVPAESVRESMPRFPEPVRLDPAPPIPIDPVVEEAKLRDQLREITDPEECWDFYLDMDSDSSIESEAYAKFVSLIRSEISTASSFEDYDGLFGLISDKDEEEFISIRQELEGKILGTLPDFEKAMEFYESYNWEEEDEAFSTRILEKALKLAITTDNARDVFDIADQDSALEEAAVSRMLELSETLEDCQIVWDEHGVDSVYGRLAVVRAAAIIAAEPDEDPELEEEEETDLEGD